MRLVRRRSGSDRGGAWNGLGWGGWYDGARLSEEDQRQLRNQARELNGDIRDLLANLITFWFFATPIIYWWNDVPGLKVFLDLNPFTHLAVSYQEILFFDGPFGHWKWLLALGAGSVVLCAIGYWLFDRLRDSFAEVV